MEAYWTGAVTAENVSDAMLIMVFLIQFKLLGNANKPSLQPPAPSDFDKPVLIIVFSG